MNGKNLVNLLKAIDLFARPQGATVKELGEHLGKKGRKFFYRIRDAVENLGFPLVEKEITDGREKRWSLEPGYIKKLPNISIPDVILTPSEIIALYLMKGESTLYKGTGIDRLTEAAFNKLALFIPEKTTAGIDKVKILSIPNSKFSKDYSGKQEIIDQLTTAILDQQTCLVKYHAFYDDNEKNFKIDPLHFFKSNEGLYLLINATEYGDIRTLAVERILHIEPTDSHFEYPQNFDPAQLLETAFDIVFEDPFQVKIEFSSNVARFIKERIWSKTQTIKEQSDGSIILSMQTSGRHDVKRWVLSYGADALVLEPEELKTAVMEEIQKTFNRYVK